MSTTDASPTAEPTYKQLEPLAFVALLPNARLFDVGAVMFPRLMNAAVTVAVFGAFFQGVVVMPAIGACFLVVAILLSSQSSSTWGIVLLGAGFALLPLGVYAHRRLSRLVAADDERLAHAATNDADAAAV